jgi:hypothetical protein
MRFHYAFPVSKLLRDLKEEGAPIRRAIEALKKNLFPEGASKVDGYANRYEILVAGYWLIYEIDRSGGETVVWIVAVEKN